MAKNDSYSSGYKYARALAADVGAEPEHHAYGGRMGKMVVRAPRMPMPRLGNLAAPGGPAAAGGLPTPGIGPRPGLPGLGAAPGPMPGAMPMPQMKHGGKAHKKMAKGGACKADAVKAVHLHEKHDHKGQKLTKLGHGGALAKMRRGEMSPEGEPSGKHGHGVNGIGQKKHGGHVKKMAMGGATGAIKKGGADENGKPIKIGPPPDASSFHSGERGRGHVGLGESLKGGERSDGEKFTHHTKRGREGVGEYKKGGHVKHKSMGGDIQLGRANADGSPSKPHIPNASDQLVKPRFKAKNAIG